MNIDDELIRRAKLRELRVFVTAARCGSLVKAAEHLGLTQPAVSKAILELEDTFGTRLLDRTRSGVDPTIQGKILLQRAMNIFDELKLARAELDHFASSAEGSMGVGCGHAAVAGLLPEILARMGEEYPRIRIRVLEADREQVFAALRLRDIDLVLARPPDENADDLLFEKLYDEQQFIVAGRNHPLASRAHVSLADLGGERWILPTEDPVVGRMVRQVFSDARLPVPQAAVSSMSIQIACSLLRLGTYITILPESVLAFHPMRDILCPLAVGDLRSSGPVGIVSLQHRDHVPAARTFIEMTANIARGRVLGLVQKTEAPGTGT